MSGLLLLRTGGASWESSQPDLAFVRWLRVMMRIALGSRMVLDPQGVEYPAEIAQRRMVHRLALAYGRLAKGTRWPLGVGLAPAPARGATDSLQSPIAPGLGLGSPRPRAVLVGDAPSQGAAWADRHGWPFISGLHTGCSSWLAEQLEAAEIPEEYLFWVNGWRWDRTVNVEALQHAVFFLRPTLVVAMGSKARRALDEIGFTEYQEVHHPQHWKRFHHRQRYHLRTVLRRHLR